MKTARLSSGFSLIEVVVALAILAFSLAALYRTAGGSIRAIGDASRYSKALVMAESMLQSRQVVPAEGWHETGQSGGIHWSISSAGLIPAKDQAVALHRVQIDVSWDDGVRGRAFTLVTAMPEQAQAIK
jgi:general secretion pathway protein I